MYRIVLVDDEDNVLAALRRVLAGIPVDDLDGESPVIECFTAAADALKRIRSVPVDLVMTDYRMPEMSGVEFLSRVIELQPSVARIILSGYADLDAALGGINQVQVARFINKPWRIHDVRTAVAGALATRSLVLENERLASLVRAQRGALSRQEAELRRLEEESPGITRLRLAEDGGILLYDEEEI